MLWLHNWDKKYVFHIGNSFEYLLGLFGALLIVNRQVLQLQPENSMVSRDSDPSTLQAWVILQGKQPGSLKVLAEGEGTQWLVEEVDDECQLKF